MRRFLLFLICLSALLRVSAQSPKRELRAAWIATVANIDWPSKPGLPAIQQQQEFISLIDELKSMGCNAVIVQVRPSADALYASELEPWSRYLTGRQGEPPFPFYDPLTFMVDECHKRNMEFHAWFNPFRALVDSRNNINPSTHVTRRHPDWVINYDGKSYLDPGNPQAREYVTRIIMDVVNRYDIDAVHLDDYFYPYRSGTLQFPDNKSYNDYRGSFTNRDDWRRNNVSLFIGVLNNNIKHIKPYMKLGISPFGVWRNSNKDPNGSDSRAGQTCYDDLYADVLLWMQKGWIDYLMPQLYWEHGHHAAAFEKLLPWWEAHSYGRHMYYGLGVYRMTGATHGIWAGTHELLSQISDIRRQAATPGVVFYSASVLNKLRVPIKDSIRRHYNNFIAIPPAMKWLDSIPPVAPKLKVIPSAQGSLLQWEQANPTNETIRFAIYRFTNNEAVNLNRADKIIAISNKHEYLDPAANNFSSSTYIVTALDRLWNESKPSNAATTRAND
jgi:uncharacterized lipoprotein YddW (UPF0748 family)